MQGYGYDLTRIGVRKVAIVGHQKHMTFISKRSHKPGIQDLADTIRQVEVVDSVSVVEHSIGTESTLRKALPDLAGIVAARQSQVGI